MLIYTNIHVNYSLIEWLNLNVAQCSQGEYIEAEKWHIIKVRRTVREDPEAVNSRQSIVEYRSSRTMHS
jgi:hypothetical protein